MVRKTIHDYVRYLRDEFFGGMGKAIYLYDEEDLKDFIEEPPYPKLRGVPPPPVEEMEFPIAIVYDGEIYWVDSAGNLWGLPDGIPIKIKSKEWLPVD